MEFVSYFCETFLINYKPGTLGDPTIKQHQLSRNVSRCKKWQPRISRWSQWFPMLTDVFPKVGNESRVAKKLEKLMIKLNLKNELARLHLTRIAKEWLRNNLILLLTLVSWVPSATIGWHR